MYLSQVHVYGQSWHKYLKRLVLYLHAYIYNIHRAYVIVSW